MTGGDTDPNRKERLLIHAHFEAYTLTYLTAAKVWAFEWRSRLPKHSPATLIASFDLKAIVLDAYKTLIGNEIA